MRGKSLASLIVLAMLVAACTGSEGGSTTEPPAPDEPTETAADEPTETTVAPEPSGDTGAADDGASAGASELLASLDGLSKDDRRAQLLELVVSEGNELVFYTTLPADIMGETVDKFTEDTGVEVLSYRAAAEDALIRIFREVEAGRPQADVALMGDWRLLKLQEADLLAPYTSPYQADLIDNSVQEYWTVNSYQVYAVSWNTNLVAEGDQPQTYMDLADPKWDGLMAVDSGDYDWYWSVSNYLKDEQGYTDEQLAQYWADVADGADFTTGHTATRQLTAAGEYHMFATDFSNGTNRDKEAGAPIEWLPPVEPLFATPEAAAILNTTERPAAAVLFMDWMLDEGQVVLAELNFDVTRSDLLTFDQDTDLRFVDYLQWGEVEEAVVAEYEALAAS